MGTRSGDLTPVCWFTLQGRRSSMRPSSKSWSTGGAGCWVFPASPQTCGTCIKQPTSNTDARLAIDMFCYSAAKQLAAMSAALGSVDTIVFTGGIGENDAQVRALICGHLGVMGVRLDADRNRNAGDPIRALAPGASRSSVRVLPAQEDKQIARLDLVPRSPRLISPGGTSGPQLVPGPRITLGALAHRRIT